MKQLAVITILAALASAGRLAALSSDTCCACLDQIPFNATSGQTAGFRNGTAVQAAFCISGAVVNGTMTSPVERCDEVTDGQGGLVCVADGLNASQQTCRAQLAEAGILCPSSGVPVVDPLNLTALAVGLGAAGMALLRRRGRSDA